MNCMCLYYLLEDYKVMVFDNKTILIVGLVIGGIASLYTHQTELASAIFGGLVGYLSKDIITVQHENLDEDDEA